MKIRRLTGFLLLVFLLGSLLSAALAAPEDDGATPVDKFPAEEETGGEDLPQAPEETPLPSFLIPDMSEGSELPPVETGVSTAIPIDKFTGTELGDSGGQADAAQVWISNDLIFDRERRAFVYRTEHEEIFSNVATGMTVTEHVWFILPEAMPFNLYRNGELLEEPDFSNISEPGAYTLTSTAVNSSMELLHFTIANTVSGQVTRFQVPDGFVVSSVRLDGVQIASQRTYVDMQTEGDYDVYYRCPVTEETYRFCVTVDHTPPVLALEAVDASGFAKGPVDISDLEPDAEIGIWLNNKQIPYQPVLTGSGNYRIVITDAAGNLNRYQFTIRVYYTKTSLVLLVVVLAIVAGVGVYAIYSRRHMRIR